jgi:hypothetical protein
VRCTKDIHRFETEDGNAQKKTQSERFSVHAWLWLKVYGACSKVAVCARLTVGKKNAARLVLEAFRSRPCRSRNISFVCVCIQMWSETYFDVFVVCAWRRLLPFFRWERSALLSSFGVLYVFASV